MTLTVGSLFSGVGGIELALERAGCGPTLWQAEMDPFARKVLAKHWPEARRYEDVREIDERAERVDILCGGFPCQDVSLAGKGAGLAGPKSGLWFEFARIIRVLRPRYVVIENVAALLVRGLDRVLGDLAEAGYDAEWTTLRASDVGAPHRRERLFILAWRVSDAHGGAVRELAERGGFGACATDERDAEPGDVGETNMDNANGQRRLRGASREAGRGVSCERRQDGLADRDSVRQSQPQGRVADVGGWTGDGGESLADAHRVGGQRCRCGAVEAGRGESQERCCGELADATRGGLGEHRGASGHAGHVDERKSPVADAHDSLGAQVAEVSDSRRAVGRTRDDASHRACSGPVAEGVLERERTEWSVKGAFRDGEAHEWPPGPGDAEGWRAYLARHPGRAPTVTGADGKPKLNAGFVGALMGFPDGWTDGMTRRQALRAFGNAVVPACGEVVGRMLVAREAGCCHA